MSRKKLAQQKLLDKKKKKLSKAEQTEEGHKRNFVNKGQIKHSIERHHKSYIDTWNLNNLCLVEGSIMCQLSASQAMRQKVVWTK